MKLTSSESIRNLAMLMKSIKEFRSMDEAELYAHRAAIDLANQKELAEHNFKLEEQKRLSKLKQLTSQDLQKSLLASHELTDSGDAKKGLKQLERAKTRSKRAREGSPWAYAQGQVGTVFGLLPYLKGEGSMDAEEWGRDAQMRRSLKAAWKSTDEVKRAVQAAAKAGATFKLGTDEYKFVKDQVGYYDQIIATVYQQSPKNEKGQAVMDWKTKKRLKQLENNVDLQSMRSILEVAELELTE